MRAQFLRWRMDAEKQGRHLPYSDIGALHVHYHPCASGTRGWAREGMVSEQGMDLSALRPEVFCSHRSPTATIKATGGSGTAKRRARGTIAAAGFQRPWPRPASFERVGHDAPAFKAPPARRFPDTGPPLRGSGMMLQAGSTFLRAWCCWDFEDEGSGVVRVGNALATGT